MDESENKKPTPVVLVVNDWRDMGGSYYKPFTKFGAYSTRPSDMDSPDVEVKLVVFTGGADITPELYGIKNTGLSHNMAIRDIHEVGVFMRALKKGLPMFGICRGAQLLCVMAGGKMVQHLDGHHGSHRIKTYDGRMIGVNSSHHQMVLPPDDARVLAWAEPALSKVYKPYATAPRYEYECMYYPALNAVGVQYHPELLSEDHEGLQYTVELAEKLINKKKIGGQKV
jgi:gamma-glutamyl-gamma-aminobutyrate hydrolase PuuD